VIYSFLSPHCVYLYFARPRPDPFSHFDSH